MDSSAIPRTTEAGMPPAGPIATAKVAVVSASQRLVSIDALRGFTMFWIMGGRELFLAIVACVTSNPNVYDWCETQVTHTRWEGYVPWDLVMPVFLFLVGTSMPFAFSKWQGPGVSLQPVYWRIIRRVIVLWILGMAAQGSLLKYQLHGLELFSNTLQAIAVGYFVTSMAMLHLRLTGQLVLLAVLVVSYWALLTFVPFDCYPAGTLERTANFARYIDTIVLGAFRRRHDFTWIITSLGFAATVLLGTTAGRLLRTKLSPAKKLASLMVLGLGCMATGWTWSYWQPLNRHLWTSSMILWAGGWSFVLLALFYGVIDVAGFKAWAFPFVVIGANALMAYVFDHVFDRSLSDILVINLANQLTEPYDELLRAIGEVGCLWLILWYMYRNGTFLKA